MDLQVLVAAMNQTDGSLMEKMNLKTNGIIANQCGAWGHRSFETEMGTVQLISTATRGVGVNRNLALQLSEADILLFSDDDVTFYDGTLQGVVDAFRQLPDADVIFFGLDMTKNGEIYEKRRNKVRRLHIWNSLRYGTARMAVRRSAVMEKRLSFSTLFGGGSRYCSGEDTIFIADCFRTGLRLYSHDYVLGKCAKDSSTWFDGFNEKYFFDRGAMLACAFPKTKHLIKWHFIRKFVKKYNLPVKMVMGAMNTGIRAFKTGRAYGEGEEYEAL